MYFFGERLSFIFRLKNKITFSGKRNIIFPYNTTKKDHIPVRFFWKDHLFRTFEENIIFLERSSFIFRLKNKMIFSGKRNIIFTDNKRKIIFQRDFFGKAIFSEYLEKSHGFSCSDGSSRFSRGVNRACTIISIKVSIVFYLWTNSVLWI